MFLQRVFSEGVTVTDSLLKSFYGQMCILDPVKHVNFQEKS